MKYRRYDPPEPVRGMSVKEAFLSGLNGGEVSKDQYLSVLVIYRRNRVDGVGG